jgi:hypothetical protein
LARSLRLWKLSVGLLFLLVACSPEYVDGLSVGLPDGSRLPVSRSTSGDATLVLPGESARFILQKPVSTGMNQDLVLNVSGSGRLDVWLSDKARARTAFQHASFILEAGRAAELHIPMPEGSILGALELQLADSDGLKLTSMAIGDRVSGYITRDSDYIIDSGTSVSGTVFPDQIQLEIDSWSDASLLIRLHSDGDARIGVKDSRGLTQFRFLLNARSGADVAIPLAAFDRGSTLIVESKALLAAAFIVPGYGAPLADLLAILAIPMPDGKDYALYRWDVLPDTLVFDFVDYATQDAYLKRLAFFAEKPGFRGRLATDAEIERLHGWNAHDYSTTTLAAFFSLVGKQGFRLNDKELRLLETLVSYGVLIRESEGSLKAGRGAIISVSQESTPALRRVFIDHESSHALYFQDAEYRRLASRLWSALVPEARRFWQQHFVWRRYDIRDEDLCVNELQAYLVQQGVYSTQAYYEALVPRLTEAYPDLQAVIEADAPFAIEAAFSDARVLDRYLKEHWGLSAGRMGRIQRL